MDEERIKAEIRLWALECLVCQLWALIYKLLPPGSAERTQQAWIESARQQTFPGADAATSDLYSGELELALNRLVGMQNSYSAKAQKGPQGKR